MRKLPRRAVALTFDDGYADNLHMARPFLDRCGFPATVFVTTGAPGAGREFWWDELEKIFLNPGILPSRLDLGFGESQRSWVLGSEACYESAAWEQNRAWRVTASPATTRQRVFLEVWGILRTLPSDERDELLAELARWAGLSREPRLSHRLLTQDEVRQLPASGLLEIGAHTVTHPALSAHGAKFQREEIAGSKRAIETQLDRCVSHFAYPYGDYSPDTVRIVREAGFSAACTTDEATVDHDAGPWQLPRYKVSDWTGEVFESRLVAMFATC
jgi:peptidoglycan/xylan/chitin deacetylase (PgdA/CDA1 family)